MFIYVKKKRMVRRFVPVFSSTYILLLLLGQNLHTYISRRKEYYSYALGLITSERQSKLEKISKNVQERKRTISNV